MVDWSDMAVIQTVADFFSKSLLCILGLYFWEIVVTFDFERSFFSPRKRRPWRWHYLCYFVCRYSFLIVLILLNITLNSTVPLTCQTTYTVNQFFGNVTIGTASLNLAFRALAIYRNNRALTVLMVTLAAGHWFVLFYCITTLKAAKNTSGSAPTCIVTGINRPWLVVLYVYTMVFDTFIMVTCLWGLWRTKPRGGRARELYKLLWADGLMYFICASVANAFPVAFMGLALNPAMDVVSTMASACVTTIVSCRAVQRLSAWGTTNQPTQDSAFKMSPPGRSGRSDTRKPTTLEPNGGEHVRQPWGKRQYFPTEGDVHLSSAMFAKTVYVDNERGDPRNGAQYEGEQKSHSDGGVFSLQTDDQSMASSPTMPAAWKQTPSIRSASTQATGGDKDKDKVPYKPTTARLSELSEQGTFPAKPPSSYRTSESVEDDEREIGYPPQIPPGPPPSSAPLPGAGVVSPMEGGTGFGSGDLERGRQQRLQWHGQ